MARCQNLSELAKLLNVDGTERCRITESEVKVGIQKGAIRRVSPKGKSPVYRMVQQPDPSESKETQCQVTDRDMRIVCGLQSLGGKNERVQARERLIGYGLISESDRFRRGYRVHQKAA